MLGQVRLEGELLEAAQTGKRLHLRVGLDVSSQVALVCKSLAALVAVVLPLLAVGQAVLGQRGGVAEGLGAGGARLRTRFPAPARFPLRGWSLVARRVLLRTLLRRRGG